MEGKKKVVIFASTSEEAKWASCYFDKNFKKQDIKILAPTIEAQFVLLRNKLNKDNYYSLFYKNNYYYDEVLKPLYLQSHYLVKYLKKKFPPVNAFGVNIIEVLQLLFEAEFLEVLYANHLFQKIKSKFNPNIYLFPKNIKTLTTGWEATHFTQAAIINDFLVDPKNIRYYHVDSQNKKSIIYNSFQKFLENPKLLFFYLWIYITNNINNNKTNNDSDKKDIDFLLFSGGRNLYYYHSIFTRIKNNLSFKYLTVSDKNSPEDNYQLQKSDIDYYELNNFLSDSLDKRINKTYQRNNKFTENILKQRNIQNYLFPKLLTSSVKKALLYKTKLTIEKYESKFIRHTALAAKIINNSKPKIVITTHDPGPSALPFVYLAKQKKIPTLLLLHGLHDVNFGADHESDYIAVWGNLLKENFVKKLSKKENTVFAVGFPFLDDIFNNKQAFWQKKNNSSAKLKFPLKIMFLLTVYQLDSAAITRFLFEIVETIANCDIEIELHFRTHPGQLLGNVKKLTNYYGINITFNENLTINEYISQSDIVVSWDTTAIIWAAIYGKPTFYTTPWWGSGHIPIVQYGAAWNLKNAVDLIEKIKNLIKNPDKIKSLNKNQQKFLKDVLGVIDGSSTDKLMKLIKNLVSK